MILVLLKYQNNTPPSPQEQMARAICGALEFVLERLHVVRVDMANNKLKNIAPVIREHGIEYERSHFIKKVRPPLLSPPSAGGARVLRRVGIQLFVGDWAPERVALCVVPGSEVRVACPELTPPPLPHTAEGGAGAGADS